MTEFPSNWDEAGTREALERALASSREEVAAEREKAERLSSSLSTLQSERDSRDRKISELLEEAVELRDSNSRISRSLRLAQVQLSDIQDSPGWKLIQKYRAWLHRGYISHPTLFKLYDRLAERLLTRSSASDSAERTRRFAANNRAGIHNVPRARERHTYGQAGDPQYQEWIDENEPGLEELARQRLEAGNLNVRPLVSIIVPVYRIHPKILRACLNSVLEQTYENWELCIADASEDIEIGRCMSDLVKDQRIHCKPVSNGGASKNYNTALDLATGEFVVFFDHDDLLAPFALFELVTLLNRDPEVDLVYSDHDYLSNSGNLRVNPLFKPDWSPEIMFSANYISHFTAARRDLVDVVGRFHPEMDGAHDWDLFLRLTERTARISHIPKVLYHRRMTPDSSALRRPEADSWSAQLRAVTAHMKRAGMPAEGEAMPSGVLRVRWKRDVDPLVSVIIPTRDNVAILARCISSLREKTAYRTYEIVIVDTGSAEPSVREYYRTLESSSNIRVLSDISHPFNYSRVNNHGAREARGDVFLFLNNDVEITNPEWMHELVGWGTYPPIGVVGAKLLYPDNTIQHAGVVVGLTGFAGHPFAGCPSISEGPYGSTTWYRDYLAVTGACMLIRRDVFRDLGGFDERFLLCGSDVEICLRARKHGYRVMVNPFAELIHYERQTRGTEQPSEDFPISYAHYRTYLESGDPYWNPNLSYRIPRIALRTPDEEPVLSFAQATLRGLGCPPPPPTAFDPPTPDERAAEERQFVRAFDFTEAELRSTRQRVNSIRGYQRIRTIMWFIPTFEHANYGGIMTILRFARQWYLDHGVRSMFAVCGAERARLMAQRIRTVYEACKDTDVFILRAPNTVSDLPAADAGLVTLWLTAYFGLHYECCHRMFYFIQDYEPAFYRAGSASALAENTYRFGFYGITNTVSLRRVYETEYHGKAFHFNPCVDRSVFYPAASAAQCRKHWQVFCYARPDHPRNAFEIVAAAMRDLKARLGESVHIVTAGAPFDVAAQGLASIVENHGLLSYEETGQLYRRSDVGVTLTLTRHPSYIPLELMASGCLVVTNRNHWTEWLLHHGENCLLAEPSATCLAEAVERGLRDEPLRRTITGNALALVRDCYSDWDSEIRRVFEYLCHPEAAEPLDRVERISN